MHLLLADDDEAMRDLLEAVLTEHGHTVEKYADGEAVWAAFERLPAPMLILDWQMPKLDGLEVCRRVRAHPAGQATFLLMITSRSGLDNLDSVLDAGADDYLAKPVTPADLAARLRIAEKGIENAAARRNAENELRKARYLAGIGEVSLALQHEINNPLAALLTNSSLITSGLLTAEEVKESLATIDVQARRIADVVKRLNAIEAPRTVEYIQGQRMLDLNASRTARKAPE
ncbi:MAG TPA: response regulator [Gemmatimonadaceae bacterium]|jgi:sigma-B regulation protein RsbU (phosphoserine phosphatase)|nr:response regulator [Gemmatimonadaceae bacterium]